MKRFVTLSLLLLTTLTPLLAQQKLIRRPGTSGVFGPARTVTMEQAKFSKINGELVEGPRVLQAVTNFSEDGLSVKSSHYDPSNGVLLNTADQTYDEGGRLLEARYYDPSGKLTSRIVHTYDSQHRLSEVTSFRSDGALTSRTVYQHSAAENTSETTMYDRDGLVTGHSTHKISVVGERTPGEDRRERRTESLTYNAAGAVRIQSSITTNPDSQEFRLERSDGSVDRTVTKSNGKAGSEQTTYARDGSIVSRNRYQNEFDSFGNLKKATSFVASGDSDNFQPTHVLYWTITYYGKD